MPIPLASYTHKCGRTSTKVRVHTSWDFVVRTDCNAKHVSLARVIAVRHISTTSVFHVCPAVVVIKLSGAPIQNHIVTVF